MLLGQLAYAGHAIRQREVGLDPTKLRLGQQEQVAHAERLRTLKVPLHRVGASS